MCWFIFIEIFHWFRMKTLCDWSKKLLKLWSVFRWFWNFNMHLSLKSGWIGVFNYFCRWILFLEHAVNASEEQWSKVTHCYYYVVRWNCTACWETRALGFWLEFETKNNNNRCYGIYTDKKDKHKKCRDKCYGRCKYILHHYR